MPLTIDIHLQALEDGAFDQFTGRGVHGFWFNRWREIDSSRGDALHQLDNVQPFTLSPLALPEELTEWARTKLAVSAYQLRTQPAREARSLRVGCLGKLTLRALEMPPYLRAALQLLVQYAEFCGSGSHTTQGLEQTRFPSAQ